MARRRREVVLRMTPQQAFQRALGASKKYTEDTVIGMGAIIKEISLLGEVVADTTKYGADILYFPCGVHIFESNATASNFINAPVKQAGTFYVTSITPNKDMNTDEYVYRNYRYETYYGVIYTRSLMTGSLSDGIRRDSGWNRVCATKVADVAKTSFSFSSTTYYEASSGQNWYMVKDGWATISLCINVNNPYHPTSSNLYYPITGLPNPIVIISNSIIAWDDTSGDTLSFMLYTDGKLFVLGGETGKQYRITFSYPVAES